MAEQWTAEKVEEVLKIANLADVISLDAPVVIDGEEATPFGDLQPSDEPSPEELAIKSMTGEKLVASMKTLLSEKEIKVISQRYGFGGRCKSLQEVADTFNPPLTRERIRQIEANAIKKLKRKLKESDFYG